MKIYMSPEYLPFYEALSSETRLNIIRLLCEKDMNVKELADALGVSSSIMTRHIRKLEEVRIIKTDYAKKEGSRQKVCTLLNTFYEVKVPFQNNRRDQQTESHTTSLPVGYFTDIFAEPPCGMASGDNIIGDLDDPARMMSPERMNAQLIWIANGYIEYKLPNYLRDRLVLSEIELSGEFGSEAPGFCDHWPSKIKVYLNGLPLCTFTTPGDIGENKGLLTPKWWPNCQYGILVVIRITKQGVFVNGEKQSKVGLSDFGTSYSGWTIRFEVEWISEKGGGMTIFGEKFGNCPQGLVFKEYYTDTNPD